MSRDEEAPGVENVRQRVTRWVEDAPSVLRMVVDLVDDRERALAAVQAADRELERLRGELAAVHADNDLLQREWTETSDMLAEIVGTAGEALRRFRVPAPVLEVPPADDPAIAPVASAAAAGPPPLEEPRARRILLVDDDTNFRAMIIDYLAGLRGYEVLPAVSGEDGLERLQGFQPDVVLLDLMMPGIGGMETLKRIKTLYPQLCVVMVTANEDLGIARQALALGAADYVTKPFDLDYLDALLNIHLTRSEAAPDGAPAALAQVDQGASVAPPTRPTGSYFARP